MDRPIKTSSSCDLLHLLFFIVLLLQASTVTIAAGNNVFPRALSAQQGPDRHVAVAQKENAPTVLEAGKPVRRELGGAEIHSYQIVLAAGQFARLVVQQQGINVFLSLYGPDGKKIVDLDSPLGSEGPEPASLIADVAGTYRLEIKPWRETAPKGHYEVKVEEIRIATPQDKPRIAGERAFAE